MGNKTHPIGFRLGITKEWQAKWFADSQREYRTLVIGDLAIRKRHSQIVGDRNAEKPYLCDNTGILTNRLIARFGGRPDQLHAVRFSDQANERPSHSSGRPNHGYSYHCGALVRN